MTLTPKYKNRMKKYIKGFNLERSLMVTHVITLFLWISTLYFVSTNIQNLRQKIPVLYSLPWGQPQIVSQKYIFLPLILAGSFYIFNLIQSIAESKRERFVLAKTYSYASFLIMLLFSLYTVRIVRLMTLAPIIIPQSIKLILIPMLVALLITLLVTPLVIKFARKYNFMDDPLRHTHPGMLLTKPTPRAGGFAFMLGILIASIILLPITSSQKTIGIMLGAFISAIVGLKDDRKDVNPYFRLMMQIFVVFIVVMSGVILVYIPNPFGSAIVLDQYKYVVNYMGTHNIHYFSVIAAMVWILVTMNFMSFANGTDGVYAGLVSITGLVTAILTFTSISTDPGLDVFVKFAALIGGAGLGMTFYTWPPQKLLWGYGATSAALMLAALSIVGSTKVATTLLILIIPFLDGAFAMLRRIRRGQSPFWGDREHLHHKLLALGWSKTKIAIFYWGTTLILGGIGLLTSGKTRALSVASFAVLAIILISSLNYLKLPTTKPKKI